MNIPSYPLNNTAQTSVHHFATPCLSINTSNQISAVSRLGPQIKHLFPKLPSLPPLPADLEAVVQLNEAWCRSLATIHALHGLDCWHGCSQEALQEEAALEASQDLRRQDLEADSGIGCQKCRSGFACLKRQRAHIFIEI